VTDENPAVFDGTTGKVIKQLTYSAFKGLLSLVKGDVGLGNVDNTSDANKPVSTATQAALDDKADLDSPTLTGTPAAPTAADGTDTTQIATTAFVQNAIDLIKNGVSSAFDTLAEIATELGLKAPAASPTFTGTVTVPNDSFTYAKLQNVSDTDKLLGRSTAGAGDIEEIACTAAGRAILDDADAAAQRTTLSAAAMSQTDFIAGVIETPGNKDYMLCVKLPYGITITEVTTISKAGTCTATFKINTTALGGTANSVSTSEQSQSHSSSNVASAGDDIQVTISSNSSCDRMAFMIKFTRTLA
jgi:hypothetical protein